MKRFTETNKWSDKWFSTLNPDQKLFWFYLCDRCDQAGIWDEPRGHALFFMGLDEFDFDAALEAYDGRVEVLPSGAWLLTKFVSFQNPRGISENSNYHKPIYQLAKKHGIEVSTLAQPLPKSRPRLQDKDKGKDKGMGKDKGILVTKVSLDSLGLNPTQGETESAPSGAAAPVLGFDPIAIAIDAIQAAGGVVLKREPKIMALLHGAAKKLGEQKYRDACAYYVKQDYYLKHGLSLKGLYGDLDKCANAAQATKPVYKPFREGEDF